MNKEFEHMTIAQLKRLYDQFKEQNPELKTAEELLEEKKEEYECAYCGKIHEVGTHPHNDDLSFHKHIQKKKLF